MDEHSRPLERAGRIRRALPFTVVAVLAFTLVPLPPDKEHGGLVVLAAMLTVAIVGAALLFPWEKFPPSLQAAPALLYFLVIVLLRHAEGGAISGYGALVILPIFRIALYGTRPQLVVALGFMFLTFSAPIVVFGEPSYPPSEWRRVFLWLIVAPVIGLTVQSLVSELKHRSQQLHDMSRTDALTSLPNRRVWDEALPRELSRADRSRIPLSVCILDLDHFKAFNDTRGHQEGDRLLKEAAAAWQEQLRPGDLLARYGGEEFALLLPDCSGDGAMSVVERLRAVTPRGQTCSVGIAVWDHGEAPEILVARADKALYEAKSAGRNRLAVAA